MATKRATKSAARVPARVLLLAATVGDEPAREIRIFKFGDNATTKGTFKLTKEGAQKIVASFAAYGNDLAIDYEHQTFEPAGNGPVPAAGWIRQGGLEVREDGLWAKVDWTERATELIKAKEYRYFSPTFSYDTKSGEILELQPIALVNYPATVDQDPLIAASARASEKAKDHRFPRVELMSFGDVTKALWQAVCARYGYDAYICDVFDDDVVFEFSGRTYQSEYMMDGTAAVLVGEPAEVERTYKPVSNGTSMDDDEEGSEGDMTMAKTLKATLGVAETAKDSETLAAAERLAGIEQTIVKLTGKVDHDEALGVVQAWKTDAGKVAQLAARVAELEGEKQTAEVEKLIADAKGAKKLTPAIEREVREVAKLSIPRAVALVATLQPIANIATNYSDVRQDAAASSPAVTVDGKSWETMPLMALHRIKREDPSMYESLRADWNRRGQPPRAASAS